MNCTECGSSNAPGTRYCTRCGTALGAGSGGGQRRETAAEPGVFGGAPAVPAAARAPSGAVRRTVLEEAPGAPARSTGPVPPPPPPPAGARPAAAAASPASRGKTVLDEGPVAPGGPGGAAASGQARIVGWMVSFDHNGAGQDYVIRAGRTRIGRGRDNEVSVFYEAKASDLHCTVIWRNGQTAVKDEGSTNGTMVNGEDIGIAAVQAIKSGDTITIGGSTFQVFLLETAVAAQIWPSSPWSRG